MGYLLDLLSRDELCLPPLPELVQVVFVHVVQLCQFRVLRIGTVFTVSMIKRFAGGEGKGGLGATPKVRPH